MREIKFRVWDKRYRKWANLLYIESNGRMTLERNGMIGSEPQEDFVLMQYTGFKDKNGNEIYEGDIVKDRNGRIGKVIFAYGSYWFYPFEMVLVSSMNALCEIIGNSFDNPELLEGK